MEFIAKSIQEDKLGLPEIYEQATEIYSRAVDRFVSSSRRCGLGRSTLVADVRPLRRWSSSVRALLGVTRTSVTKADIGLCQQNPLARLEPERQLRCARP